MPRALISLLLTTLLVTPVWAAPSYDTNCTGQGTTSATCDSTVAAGANVMIVCVAIREDGGNPQASSAVTVEGAAATMLDAQNVAGGSPIRVEMWYKLAPTTGAGVTVSVTSDASTEFTVVGGVSFIGVAQTSTFNTQSKTQDATGTNANMDVDSIASAAGELAVLCGAVRDPTGSTPTLSADATSPVSVERYELAHSTDTSVIGTAYTEDGAASTINMRVDISAGAQWAAIGVSMRPLKGRGSPILLQ